jgi:hypothetical protein
MRPHLRVTSEPKRDDVVKPEASSAKPPGSDSEAKKAEGSSPKEDNATSKRADAAEPAPQPENAPKPASTLKAAPASQ